MIDSEVQLYNDQILQFCKSIAIKSELLALQMKDAMYKSYGTEITSDDQNPYYQHLCGQYSKEAGDEPIYIIDDGEKVILDQELMDRKPWIRKKYNIYGTAFSNLVNEYKGREGFLLLLVTRPCLTMKELLEKPDFSLLYYDDSILEEQERHSIVEALKQYVDLVKQRWLIKEFAYEELYGMDLMRNFYTLLQPMLHKVRIKNLKTQYAHTFHIWNHLSSYGLDDYRNVLSIEQQLFLYKNIDYIVKNIGKHQTLAILIEKILSQNYLSIEPKMVVNDYPVNAVTETLDVQPHVVSRTFDSTPITRFFDNKATSIEQFYDLLNKGGFITDNDLKDYATTERKLSLVNHTVLQTKFLELKRSTPQRPFIQFLFSMLMGGIIHNLDANRLKFSVPVIEEKLDFSETLEPKVAFMLLMYLLLKESGAENPVVPKQMKAFPCVRDYNNLIDANIKTILGQKNISDFINITEFKNRFKELDTMTEFNFSTDFTNLLLSFAVLTIKDLFLCYENEYGLNEALNKLHNQMFNLGTNVVSPYGTADITMLDWLRTNAYVVYDFLVDLENDPNVEVSKIIDQLMEGFLPASSLNDPKFNLNISNDEKYEKLKQLFIQLCSYNVVFIDPNLKNQSTYLHDPLTFQMSPRSSLIGLSDLALIAYTPIPYPHPNLQIGELDPRKTGDLTFTITVNDPLDYLLEYKLELSRNSNFSSIDKIIKGTTDLLHCEIGIKPDLIIPGTVYYARVCFRSRLFDWCYTDYSNVVSFNSGKIVNPTLFPPVLTDTMFEDAIATPTITVLNSSSAPEFEISAFALESSGVAKGTLILTADPMTLTHEHQDLHIKSRWLAAEDAEMTNIIHDSGWVENLLEYRTGWDKTLNSNIYFAVIFEGWRYGESAMSNIASFEMRNIKKPVILDVEGQFNPLATNVLKITSDAFTCLGDYQDTHIASRWIASLDEDVTKIIYNSDWDPIDLTTETTLPFKDTYSNGYRILTPSISKGMDQTGHVFDISAFDSVPVTTNETPDSLYLTVQYKGQVLGLSDRSDPYRVFSQLEPRGHATITIEPGEALTAGAAWRRKGTIPWRSSGYTEEYLLVGSYLIEMKDAEGFITPEDIVVTIVADQTTTQTVTYTEAPKLGGLRVFITPQEAADRSGWWRVVDINGVWCQSGLTINDLPAGVYTLNFTEVEDFIPEEPMQVTVVSDVITEVTVEFSRSGAKVTVNLLPPEVIPAGGKWRLVGSTVWNDSGVQVVGIASGTYNFEFITPTDFFAPTPEPITVVNGDVLEYNMTYGFIGVQAPVIEELKINMGTVVSGRKRIPPVNVTVDIINGEAYITPLTQTVPYRSTATFTVDGGVVIKDNAESIIIGGTAP